MDINHKTFRFRVPDDAVKFVEDNGEYYVLTNWGDKLKIVSPKATASVIIRLFDNVEKTACGCWVRKQFNTKNRYPSIRFQGKKTSNHRISYTVFKGEITGDLFVCHTCDVSHCCNPSHLYLGTILDNARDRESRNRHPHTTFRSSENPAKNLRKLTADQVIKIREMNSDGWFCSDLAIEFGVSANTIIAIVQRKTYKDVK